MAEGKIIDWFTSNGQHIPIHEGESRDDAYSKWAKTDRERSKQSDIERRKAEADVLNEIEYRKQHKDDNIEASYNAIKDGKTFKDALDKAKDSRDTWDKWRVDNEHDAKWYEEHGAKLLVSKGGSTVAVTKDGDIVSVCKMRGDKTTTGAQMLSMAVKNGGIKLDSFSGNHAFYVDNGFKPVSWTNFSEEYAPAGWKESGMGHEPVVFYSYVGVGNVPNEYKGDEGLMNFLGKTKESTDYDTAMKARDKTLNKK